MKKLFTALAFIFVLFACSSDDNSSTEQKYNIVGNWKIEAIKLYGEKDFTYSDLLGNITLKEDGKYNTNFLGENVNGDYNYDGQSTVRLNSDGNKTTINILSMDDEKANVFTELHYINQSADLKLKRQ